MVLRYSDEFGLGVYAGVPFMAGEVIEESISIAVPNTAVHAWAKRGSLNDYVEGLNETHGFLLHTSLAN